MLHAWYRLEEQAWAACPEHEPRWLRWSYDLVRTASVARRGVSAHGVIDRAYALAMVTAMGLVPVLATAFSVAQAVGLGAQLEPILYNAFGVVPDAPAAEIGTQRVASIIHKLLAVVEEVDATRLGVVGVLLTIVAVIQTLGRVEQALNKTWGIGRSRSFARRFSDYLSVSFIVPLLLAGATTLGATHTLSELWPGGAPSWMLPLLERTPDLGPLALAFFAFSFLYYFLPNTRVPLSAAAVGGIFATGAWAILQRVWLTVQVNASQVGTIYGTFAAIPLLLIFLIVLWIVVLAGGELAHGFQRRRLPRPELERGQPSAAGLLRDELATLLHITKLHQQGADPASLHTLATALGVTEGTAEQALNSLVEAGWALRLQDRDQEVYLPRQAAASLPLGEALAGLLSGPRQEEDDGPRASTSSAVAKAQSCWTDAASRIRADLAEPTLEIVADDGDDTT